MLKIKPNPTFDAEVPITEPGAEPTLIKVTFKVQSKTQISAIFKDLIEAKRDQVEILLGLIAGWDETTVAAPFTKEALADLIEERTTFFNDIVTGYGKALEAARSKN